MRSTTSDVACQHFRDGEIDLLHLDGEHTLEAVSHDFESWLPKLSKRGVVILHDTNERQTDFGVWRLWETLSEHYPSFEVPYGHGLGVLVIGREPPQQLCEFIDAMRSRPAEGRDLLFALGE